MKYHLDGLVEGELVFVQDLWSSFGEIVPGYHLLGLARVTGFADFPSRECGKDDYMSRRIDLEPVDSNLYVPASVWRNNPRILRYTPELRDALNKQKEFFAAVVNYRAIRPSNIHRGVGREAIGFPSLCYRLEETL